VASTDESTKGKRASHVPRFYGARQYVLWQRTNPNALCQDVLTREQEFRFRYRRIGSSRLDVPAALVVTDTDSNGIRWAVCAKRDGLVRMPVHRDRVVS
jgi:hypothetical protein